MTTVSEFWDAKRPAAMTEALINRNRKSDLIALTIQ
jgi:hypothetical protein